MHFTTLFGLCLVTTTILLITLGELPAVQAQFMRFPLGMGMGFPRGMGGYRGFGMRPGGFGRFYG